MEVFTKLDVFPPSQYSKKRLPKDGYFTIQLMEKDTEYIIGVSCEGLETNANMQSLDIVVQDTDGNRRWMCYVRFHENNTFQVYLGRNPAH